MTDAKKRPAPSSVPTEGLGPYVFSQPRHRAHRLTTDSVLLVDFVLPHIKRGFSVADLGTGTGAIPLMLAHRTDAAAITGVEIDPDLAEYARENVQENNLAGRVEIIEGDLRLVSRDMKEGAFDLVVSNPPYVKKGAGRVSPYPSRATARSEQACTMAELVTTASRLVGKKGRIAFVYPAGRLPEMLSEIERAGLRAARLKFVHTGAGKEAKLFLIEAGRGGGELVVEEPVFL